MSWMNSTTATPASAAPQDIRRTLPVALTGTVSTAAGASVT